ncbi:aspartate/glutamate racemase family protein [Marinagarivorans algicola]|uniref:aspartate/glutamate racemase family protein n=1 Tax=Marinagarivorans algicola TaxID=1513270 RepID=UPI0006B9A028|nr:aspartate/glutamate racemase family protein [Marinagarivorans algicola]
MPLSDLHGVNGSSYLERDYLGLGLLDLGERTVEFYKAEIARQYAEKIGHPLVAGGLHIVPADFSEINTHLPNQFAALKPLMADNIKQSVMAGIRVLIMPNITLHETIDQLEPALMRGLKIIHPVLASVRRLQAEKVKAITLIASGYSSTSPRLAQYFNQHDIAIIRPSTEHIACIDEIRKNTYLGKETDENKKTYHRLITHYQQSSPVVVACTELSLLLNAKAIDTVFDTARLQIEAALEACILSTNAESL